MSDEKDFVLFVGNLSDRMTEKLLHELFLQAGPVEDVTVKKGFGFITFTHHESIPYTVKLFDGIQLFGRTLALKPRDGSIYANGGTKDIRRSRSMNDFPMQGPSSSFNTRDNRSHQNMQHGNSIKKIPSLTEINMMKTGARGGTSSNQSWSSNLPESVHHPGNFQGKQFDTGNQYDRTSQQFNQEGNADVSFFNTSTGYGEFRDTRNRIDGKHSSKSHNLMHERNSGMQSNSFGNRNYKDSPSNRPEMSRDFDSRHHGKNIPNMRRDNQSDRNIYFDRKNSTPNAGGFISSQDSWNRSSGNRSFGSSSMSPAAQNFDRNINRRNSSSNFTPRNRYDHGQYRPHHDKPYNRQHNTKYSTDSHSKGGYNTFGNGRRQ